MFGSTLETIYDFKGGRYFADGLDNNEAHVRLQRAPEPA